MLEDWLDESIGIGTRFIYYEFRASAGKQIDPSVLSHLVMQLARRHFGINPAWAKLAPVAPECCFKPVAPSLARAYLVGDSVSVADNPVAAKLPALTLDSPIPS